MDHVVELLVGVHGVGSFGCWWLMPEERPPWAPRSRPSNSLVPWTQDRPPRGSGSRPGSCPGATGRLLRDGYGSQRPPIPRKDQLMATIHLHETTTATPEQFIAGLTDFGPGRSKLFGNSADKYLKVHDRGRDWADVTEGSGGVWERLSYDWSDPDRVVARTTDSNTWGGQSGHTYTYTRNANGTTDIDYVVVREGKNLRGRFLGLILGTVGKRVLAKAFADSVKGVESRNAAREAEHA